MTAVAARTVVDGGDAVAAVTAVAEQSAATAVAAAETVPALSGQQAGIATVAPAVRAGDDGPAVTVASDDAAVGMRGGAVAEQPEIGDGRGLE